MDVDLSPSAPISVAEFNAWLFLGLFCPVKDIRPRSLTV